MEQYGLGEGTDRDDMLVKFCLNEEVANTLLILSEGELCTQRLPAGINDGIIRN